VSFGVPGVTSRQRGCEKHVTVLAGQQDPHGPFLSGFFVCNFEKVRPARPPAGPVVESKRLEVERPGGRKLYFGSPRTTESARSQISRRFSGVGRSNRTNGLYLLRARLSSSGDSREREKERRPDSAGHRDAEPDSVGECGGGGVSAEHRSLGRRGSNRRGHVLPTKRSARRLIGRVGGRWLDSDLGSLFFHVVTSNVGPWME